MTNNEYEFIENDVIGESTLEVMSEADAFNQWMYHTIKPHCQNDILEIGSGVGNISRFFLNDNFNIYLSDIRKAYCQNLKTSLGGKSGMLGVEEIDLTDENFDDKFEHHFNNYNTVFALNVVEHIYDDLLAIKNCKKLLKRGGKLIILVPSYQSLFNQFDIGLGHYRRYNIKSLTSVFKQADLDIIHKQYFNFAGILGWFVSGKILNKKSIPKNQMKLYNKLVPVFRIIDKGLLNKIGLSTIIVGQKIT